MDIRVAIVAVTASLLTVLYIYLSALVIKGRRQQKLMYMVNDNDAFVAKFRAHANFAEYVPITLLMMYFAAYFKMPVIGLALLAVVFVCGRYSHAYGLIHAERNKRFKPRIYGMQASLATLGFLALYDLLSAAYYLVV